MARPVVPLALTLVLAALVAPTRAVARCGTDPGDAAALAAVRALADQQCDCQSAVSQKVYRRCVSAVADLAVAQGQLSASCRSAVKRCAAKSTCGRPGAVACCRTKASGRTKCNVKRSAAACVAPRGGSACTGQRASCCDACLESGGCAAPTTTTTLPPGTCGNGVREGAEACDGADFGSATCPGSSVAGAFLTCLGNCTIDFSGCPTGGTTTTTTPPASTTTTVTSPTTTTSTVPDVGCRDPLLSLPPLLKLPVDVVDGSSTCGGPGLVPAPTPPFAGALHGGSGQKLADLGTNCLYLGGGSSALAPFGLTPGSSFVLSVVGLRGASAIAGPSDGTGPADCSRGAGPGTHCINGSPGTDGAGACRGDGDCGGAAGSCALDANCFFGAPLSITAPVAACAVNVALTDFCGEAHLLRFSVDVRGALSSRAYLGACPTCTAGRCQGGARDGQACSGSDPSIDCLPAPAGFLGAFTSTPALSTEPLELRDPAGLLCAGQTSAGAFGRPDARRLRTDGQRLNLLTLQATLAGPFCAQTSGNPLVDAAVGLPAPGAATLKGRIDLIQVLRLFGF